MEIILSVVMPCYNHAKYIEEAVHSVLASTYKNFEIIIVNDGSTDNSEEIALQLTKESDKITYLKQKNNGPSSARNHGIRMAKGKYILPLDSDDKISPNFLEQAVQVLDKQDNTKVVTCQGVFFGQREGLWNLPTFNRSLLARKNMICACAMYRRTDWERTGGYSEEMTWGWEDWEFWISMLKHGGDVCKLPEVGFHYRVTSNSRRKKAQKSGKQKTIHFLNQKHKDFLHHELGGPLRQKRKWSKTINKLSKGRRSFMKLRNRLFSPATNNV